MAESNRTITAPEPAQLTATTTGERASGPSYGQVVAGQVASETPMQPTTVRQRRIWLARLLISMVVLPLPLFTLIVAVTQPQFEENLHVRSVNAAFFAFLILAGLFAYHAFMFWYNPFVSDDDDLTRRKERVVNALSLAFSIPGVGGLIFTFITGTSTSSELSLLEQLAHNFPLQGWAAVLLLALFAAWLVWLGYYHVPPVQRWAQQLHRAEQRPMSGVRGWLGQQWARLRDLWRQWQGRIILLVSSFLSIGLLMSILVNFLHVGIGLDWAVAAVLIALFLMQMAGTLAVRLVSPAALIWCNGATLTLLFAVEQLTRRGALVAGDRVLSHWIAWGVIIEVLSVFVLLGRQMRRRIPPGTRVQAFRQAF
jgi:hypothetical protein